MRHLHKLELRPVMVIAFIGVFGCTRSAEAADFVSGPAPPAGGAAQVAPGDEFAAHSRTAQAGQQSSTDDDVIDGFILIVDCSGTMATPAFKSKSQWAVSHMLDAAPDGVPMSVLLFGHNPAVPKNLVEVVGDLREVPLTWRSKATYRRAVQQVVPSKHRVFFSGALNVARDIVLSTNLDRVAIVIITDGQNAGDKLELAIDHCVRTPAIFGVRVIGLGVPEHPALRHVQQLFQGGKLSLGYARTPEELTDTLRPIAAEFDIYRQVQFDKRRAEVSNLKATLADSNGQLEHAGQELNHCRLDLTKEIEVGQGLQQSVQNLTAQLADLNRKFKDRAKQDGETILQLQNLATSREDEISKLNDETSGMRTQIEALEVSNQSAKEAVRVRTLEAQALQATLDKCRIDIQALDATAKSLQDELCCCTDVSKKLNDDLIKVTADFNNVTTQLAAKDAELAATKTRLATAEADLTSTKAELAATKTALEDTKEKLTACETELSSTKSELAAKATSLEDVGQELTACETENKEKDLQLTEARQRISNLEGDLKAAQSTALGAAREMAAAKKDAPNAIFNSPMQAEGGAGPAGGSAGGSAGGAAGGAAGGGAGGGAAGAPGGGGSDGGIGSLLGAAGMMAFL